MSEAFERVLDALTSFGSRVGEKRNDHAMVQCPAHEDGRPSLSVDAKDDRVLLFCHAHCQVDEIIRTLGLEFTDLFDGEPDGDRAVPMRYYTYRYTNGDAAFIVERYYPKTFRQRRPGTLPGDKGGIKGIDPILYRAPEVWAKMQSGPTKVWLVDGEKDVETAERHGLVATCPPGFGKRWRASYTAFLRPASEVIIVADQDSLKPDGSLGPGKQFAIEARNALRAESIRARVVAPACGKDLTDHFTAEYGEDDFTPEPTASVRPRGMSAADLMGREFEEVCYAVEKVLPSGLTIFAGSPKAGKSWVMLDICLAVAAGGPALSTLRTNQGCALYLAREDTYRRLQSRIALIMGGTMAGPKNLELVPQEHDWPGGEEGLANMTEWAEECGSPRLVVLDTLAKVEPEMGEDGRRGAYVGNYSMMTRYKAWADRHDCAVVMVHHDRKAASAKDAKDLGMESDPFTKISGTRGLTGAADTLWFLETVRGTGEGALHITGRDVVEQSLELRKAGPLWSSLTPPE
jgi:hypothetical protein